MQSRPKNLNLFTIHFPLPAIVSILHRISGFILFLSIPLFIWLLQYSLTETGFETLTGVEAKGIFKFIVWLFWIPFSYHFVAGIRHLLSDVHVGDSLKGGRLGAKLTFIFTIILIILAGIWLW